MKSIAYSEHAICQFRRRRISKLLVQKTLTEPDQVIASYKGRLLYQKSFGDKILEVVAVDENAMLVIVTGYYLKRKYEN